MSESAKLVPETAPGSEPVPDVPHEPKATTAELLKVEPRGWWVEGSAIDRLDKALSLSVFTLELGYTAELLLTAPGIWFGLPVPAFIMSNLLTWYSFLAHEAHEDMKWLAHLLNIDHDPDHVVLQTFKQVGIASPASLQFLAGSLIFIAIWGVIFYRYLLTGHVEKAYLINKHLMFPSLLLPVIFGKYFSPRGYKAATFFICSWFVAQSVSSGLKTVFSRIRPTVAPSTAEKVGRVNRAFPSYRTMLSLGESVFESFPSGDSVGAACFSCVLFILRAPTWTVWICVLTAFCRMYFHAHHLLDVAAGLSVGWGVTLTLNYLFGIEYFDVMHTVFITVAFIVFIIRLQKLKPALPEHLKVKGRKGF